MKRHIWTPLLLAGALGLAAPIAGYAVEQDSAMTLLLQRADYWKEHGRMDLAVQNWRQVLNSNPNQPQALVGLARDAATQGNRQDALQLLARLKQVAPDNPAIKDVEALLALGPNSGPRLAEASKLAADKNYEQALATYDTLFKGNPPPKWAETYFQIMTQVPGGQKRAVNELTALAQAHPDELAYQRVLGQILTYESSTRTRGIELLSRVAKGTGSTAQAARGDWHQALVWMGDDPAAIPYLQGYLSSYRDPKLSAVLRRLQNQSAVQAAERARGQALGNAYRTMNQGQLDAARDRFAAILEKEPDNVKALEGLGDVAFKEKQYDDAARYYTQARGFSKSADERRRIDRALQQAYFWSWMVSGNQKMQADQPSAAIGAYRQALSILPNDALATQALANAYVKSGKTSKATDLYAELTKKNPNSEAAWLGYIQTLNEANRPQAVLNAAAKIPANVSLKLERSAAYASIMAGALMDKGKSERAMKLLQRAEAKATPAERTDLQIQKGWLLYKAKDDHALYALLTDLLDRQASLNEKQRNEVHNLYLAGAQREAQSALKQGDGEAADAILNALDAQFPGDPAVARIQANLLVQQKKFDEAESIYKQIGPGDTVGDMLAAIGSAMANQDNDQARSWLDAGLSQYPDNVPLKEMQARLDLQNGDARSAKKALRSALASLPQAPRRYFSRSKENGTSERSRYPFASFAARSGQGTSRLVAGEGNDMAYPFASRAGQKGDDMDETTRSPEQTGVAVAEIDPTRARIQEQIDHIDAHTSSEVSGALFGRSRSGASGLDQMSLVGGQIEGSVALGYNTRLTARLTPIRVDSGSSDAKSAKLFGTGPVYGGAIGASSAESGLGLTVGVDSVDYGVMLGTSPQGFTLSSLIGQVNLHPEGSPVGFSLYRQSVTDSVLSFAGAKDPQTGTTWGGAFRNGLGMNFGVDNGNTALFGGLKLAYINGTNLKSNTQVEANVGASWPVLERKDNNIRLGFDALSMFYAHDSSHFTVGQGGYFSPSYYFRPAATAQWSGMAGKRFGYNVEGFLGWQTFHRSSSPYFPTDSTLQALSGDAYYPSETVNGVGYGLKLNLGYAITRNLTLSGFMGTDNSQDYSNLTTGLQLRYWFSPQVIRQEKDLYRHDWLMGVDYDGSSPGDVGR